MTRYVVLLRGINVGKHNRIRMPALRGVLEGLGGTGVTTYLQSGNAVLDWEGEPGDLRREVSAALIEEADLDVAVMVRTGPQLAAVVEANPWPDELLEPKLLHAAFLSGQADPELVAAVDVEALAPERLAFGDGVLYLYYAAGVQRSKLDKVRLGVDATARNWTTTLALRDCRPERRSRDGRPPAVTPTLHLAGVGLPAVGDASAPSRWRVDVRRGGAAPAPPLWPRTRGCAGAVRGCPFYPEV